MKKEVIGKYVAVLGVVLFWAPLWGVVESYLVLSPSFQEISLFSNNQPEISQEELSSASLSFLIGTFLFLVALCLLTFSVVGLHYRAKWLYWVLVIYSTMLIFVFPIGTFIGIAVLATLVFSRRKFGQNEDALQQNF